MLQVNIKKCIVLNCVSLLLTRSVNLGLFQHPYPKVMTNRNKENARPQSCWIVQSSVYRLLLVICRGSWFSLRRFCRLPFKVKINRFVKTSLQIKSVLNASLVQFYSTSGQLKYAQKILFEKRILFQAELNQNVAVLC